jgi:predicted DNA-binding protein (MmcQ/YjbR family)
MPGSKSVLAHLRKVCLGLPEAVETLTWGEPHFRVAGKIFCGCGQEDGRPVIGFKLEREHAEAVLGDPRFRRAPYVGRHGWVSMDASRIRDWAEVRALVEESYRLIAPKGLSRGAGGLVKPARPRTRRARRP